MEEGQTRTKTCVIEGLCAFKSSEFLAIRNNMKFFQKFTRNVNLVLKQVINIGTAMIVINVLNITRERVGYNIGGRYVDEQRNTVSGVITLASAALISIES